MQLFCSYSIFFICLFWWPHFSWCLGGSLASLMVLASLGGGLSLDQPSHHQTDGWGHEKKAVGVMNLMLMLMAEVWWQGHTFPQQSDDHERGKVKDLLLWWWVIMVSLLMVTALPSWLPGHSSGERLGFVVRGCATLCWQRRALMLGRSHQGLVSNVLKDSLTNEVVKRSGEPARWSRIRFSSLPQTGAAFADVDVNY